MVDLETRISQIMTWGQGLKSDVKRIREQRNEAYRSNSQLQSELQSAINAKIKLEEENMRLKQHYQSTRSNLEELSILKSEASSAQMNLSERLHASNMEKIKLAQDNQALVGHLKQIRPQYEHLHNLSNDLKRQGIQFLISQL